MMKAIEVSAVNKVREIPEKTYDDTGSEKPGGGTNGKSTWENSASGGYRGVEKGSSGYNGSDYCMRKLKMPVFGGEDAHEWIYRVERYFKLQGINRREQLRAAALCLEGEALAW